MIFNTISDRLWTIVLFSANCMCFLLVAKDFKYSELIWTAFGGSFLLSSTTSGRFYSFPTICGRLYVLLNPICDKFQAFRT